GRRPCLLNLLQGRQFQARHQFARPRRLRRAPLLAFLPLAEEAWARLPRPARPEVPHRAAQRAPVRRWVPLVLARKAPLPSIRQPRKQDRPLQRTPPPRPRRRRWKRLFARQALRKFRSLLQCSRWRRPLRLSRLRRILLPLRHRPRRTHRPPGPPARSAPEGQLQRPPCRVPAVQPVAAQCRWGRRPLRRRPHRYRRPPRVPPLWLRPLRRQPVPPVSPQLRYRSPMLGRSATPS